MVYGSAMGSFAVERFGFGRFEEITLADVKARVRATTTWCTSRSDEDAGG